MAVSQLPALISMPFVQPNMAWYQTLAKPLLTPPNMLFGLMWSILYVLLGISAAIAFRKGLNNNTRAALGLFIVQLALNALWTPIFFGLHSFTGATVVIVLMLGEGVYLHRAIKRLDKVAAWLLLPYWVWLSFATYLTVAFQWLNG